MEEYLFSTSQEELAETEAAKNELAERDAIEEIKMQKERGINRTKGHLVDVLETEE